MDERDEVELSKTLWVRAAVLDTGGVVQTHARTDYIYERPNWKVTFERSALDHVLGSKDERALYAELYRWHRDPAVAFPPETREWIRSAINVAPRSRFEAFSVCGEGGVSVLYSYDGSGGREGTLGFGDSFPSTMNELLTMLGISESAFPGKDGLDWMRDLFGAEFWGQGADGLRFRTSLSAEVMVPARLVNLRAEGQIRQIMGRSAASSA